MRPVKVSFIDNAADEWERLNKVVAEEKSKKLALCISNTVLLL